MANEIVQADNTPKEIVKYSNEINELRLKGFEVSDLNLFGLICARVKDRENEEIVLSYREIRKITGYKARSNDRMYRNIERMAEIFIAVNGHYTVGRKSVRFNLFQEFANDPDTATLTVSVAPRYTHLFTNVAKEFTVFELEEFISLNGKYAKGLYRILKQWRTVGHTREYGLEEIKNALDTPDYEARYITSFVIKPAVEEIKNRGAFQELQYEAVHGPGRGRPIKGYIFRFRAEKPPKKAVEDKDGTDSRTTQRKRGHKKKNDFIAIESNNYDFDDLEIKLLGEDSK